MLKDSDAFSGFSVDDIEKAKAFYGETLGIETDMSDAGLALRIPGRRPVFIYPKDNHQPATYTVLNFPVESVDAAVDQLATRRACRWRTTARTWGRTRRASRAIRAAR